MVETEKEILINEVEEHLIEPNSVITLTDWVKIRKIAKKKYEKQQRSRVKKWRMDK